MGTNYRDFKIRVHKAATRVINKRAAEAQQFTARTVFKYLALYTPVDTGLLAGSYVLRVGAGRPSKVARKVNKTRRISLENMQSVSILDGTKDATIVNAVPYGPLVDQGTSTRAGQFFIRRAKQATLIELQRKGLRGGV